MLEVFQANTVAFDKAFIRTVNVAQGSGGNLLGKWSAEMFNLLRVGPPTSNDTISCDENSNGMITNYTEHREIQNSVWYTLRYI